MPSAKLSARVWSYLENALFIFVFFYTAYYLVAGFSTYLWDTLHGKGFIQVFSKHVSDKEYYNCVLAIVLFFVSFFYLSEIGIKNKFLYLVKPPGWSPGSGEHTAAIVRGNFLKENPMPGFTSKNLIVEKIFRR